VARLVPSVRKGSAGVCQLAFNSCAFTASGGSKDECSLRSVVRIPPVRSLRIAGLNVTAPYTEAYKGSIFCANLFTRFVKKRFISGGVGLTSRSVRLRHRCADQ